MRLTGVAARDEWVRSWRSISYGRKGKSKSIRTVVDVQHQSVSALDQDLGIAILRVLHELDRVDDEGCEGLAVFAEAGNLLLDVVIEKVAKSLLVTGGQLTDGGLEGFLVEDLVDSDSAAKKGSITWAWYCDFVQLTSWQPSYCQREHDFRSLYVPCLHM